MAHMPNLSLRLPARRENVLVVRQALTGMAEMLGLDAIDANDLNTAATEACNNVVMHAYRDPDDGADAQHGGDGKEGDEEHAAGPLEVQAQANAEGVLLIVRDRGHGMPSLDPDEAHGARGSLEDEEDDDEEPRVGESARMGLAVIEALAHSVEFAEIPGGGTEVRMRFAMRPRPSALSDTQAPAGATGTTSSHLDGSALLPGSVYLRLSPSTLARGVLPRVLGALAARAYFTVDRIGEVQLIAAALAANAPDSVDGAHLAVGVTVAPRSLALRIGPLHAGRGESLLSAAADGLAPVIDRLADATGVSSLGGAGESLELELVDRR